MDKQDGLASVQEDELSSREGRVNCQDEEREVAFPSILAALKRSQISQENYKSLLSISSSDLSSSSGEEKEEEGEEGGRSLPESPEGSSNKEEVRER